MKSQNLDQMLDETGLFQPFQKSMLKSINIKGLHDFFMKSNVNIITQKHIEALSNMYNVTPYEILVGEEPEKVFQNTPEILFIENKYTKRLNNHFNNYMSIDDLIRSEEYQLLRLPNIGKKAISEIKDKLDFWDLKLGLTHSEMKDLYSNEYNPKVLLADTQDMKEKFPIEKLKLKNETSSRLREENITTIGDLIKYDEISLLRLPNIGKLSLNEIKDTLSKYDLRLNLR